MPQQEIELILMRQLAGSLAMPIFIVDKEGQLLYYNPAAEALLGRRFDEAGQMRLEELSDVFEITSEDGSPVPPEAIPLWIALQQQRPAHMPLNFRGLDGVTRRIEVTAIPLTGHGGRFLGAVAFFWERQGS